MITSGHEAVRWDGKRVLGGSPLWLVLALKKGPMEEGSVIRVRDKVHVFVANPMRSTSPHDGVASVVVQVADPGDWILHDRRSGDLLVQRHGQMVEQWEFRNGGYYRRAEQVAVRAETEQRLEEGLRILAGWTVVTATSHPRLHSALEAISHDRGSGSGYATYSVPPRWVDVISTVERVLAGLCDEDLETLCIGEKKEQVQIAEISDDHMVTHEMLEAFFEDWEEGT